MIEINQDILKIQVGIVCHQVNCQGKMGAGIALKIKRKWPQVYEDYLAGLKAGSLSLGKSQLVQVTPKIAVCNMAAQDRYGRDKRYTDYEALARCLLHLQDMNYPAHWPVCFPYKIGCVNAGGDWKVVKALIGDIFPNAYICKL